MILEWFKSREIAELGALLADKFVLPRQLRSITQNAAAEPSQSMALLEFLQQVDAEVQRLRLNFFKRAKLANSFKWRLLEKGVPRETADQATKRLVLHLSCSPQNSKPDQAMAGRSLDRPVPRDARGLLLLGNRHFAQREYAEAITAYQSVIKLDPRHAEAFGNLG